MAEMMYCPHCGRDVNVSKWTGTRIVILIILLFLGLILGLIYLIYVATRKESCPVCGTPIEYLQPPRFGQQGPSPYQQQTAYGGQGTGTATELKVCPSCGSQNAADAEYCGTCGAKLR